MPGGWGRGGGLWEVGCGLARRYAPRSAVVAAVVLAGSMVAVTVLRWFFDGAGEVAALLYVVPIALGALRFGRRGGLVTAGFGVVGFVVMELVHARGDIDVTGWMGPLMAMVLMGGLVSHLSESVARHEAARALQARRLEELLHARYAATEASDALVQSVAAACWMLEAGRTEEVLALLNVTVADGIARLRGTFPPLPPEQTPEEHLAQPR